MNVHLVRLRKRLDPKSLVAAERHQLTGRLAPHGRQQKASSGAAASLMRGGFSGFAGLLAAGALVTAVGGGAAAAVRAGSDGHPSHAARAPVGDPSTASPTPSPVRTAPVAAQLPAPCQLVGQAAAQRAVGVPVDTSENKPTSCLYAGTAPAPFRTVEVTYHSRFDAEHVRRTLTAAHVAAKPIEGLGSGAFAHPAFVQTANGTTQFLPAEAVVPIGSVTVVISTITLDEAGARLVDPAHDEAVAVALARAVLTAYAGQ